MQNYFKIFCIEYFGEMFFQQRSNLLFEFLLTYLLTYSTVQSPSWAANWYAASQEIPRISRNPKVHYRIHKCTPSVSILGQPNPVHIPTSHLLLFEFYSNILLPARNYVPRHEEVLSSHLWLHAFFMSMLNGTELWVSGPQLLYPLWQLQCLVTHRLEG